MATGTGTNGLPKSNSPEQLGSRLAAEGISEENYDMWVAGHEAAHAAIGIGHGGTIQHIGTAPMALGTSLSRARCEWKSLTSRLTWGQILELIAAGPAYDDLHASDYGITAEVRRHVQHDRRTANEVVFSHINGSDEAKEASWQQAIKAAKTALQNEANGRKVDALQRVIFKAIRDGTPLLTADEVRIAIAAAQGNRKMPPAADVGH